MLEAPKRGYCRITPRGSDVLKNRPSKIDVRYLKQFPEFNEFQSKKWSDEEGVETVPGTTEGVEIRTPEETLDNAYQKLRAGLVDEIIQALKNSSPSFFDRLVVDVLVKMGYGGSRQDAGKAVGGSGDGGIDGIIKEDKLGLDAIYIQAKRWEGVVGRPDLQKFAGALQGQRANKGIFITTSSFTGDAIDYAGSINAKIVLIDGQTLAQLMIDHNVGVSAVASYEIKK